MRAFIKLLTASLLLISTLAGAADEGFPGRAEYPKVKVYELDKLRKDLSSVVVVDTRSILEFETLRIVGSINIPVAAKTFEDEIKSLRNTTSKPIIFYCNGRRCYKSYIAVKRCREAGIDNVFAYDAGIFEWAKAYPDKAALLGKSPVNPLDLINKKSFQARLLNPDKFSERIADEDTTKTMVLDVRDKFQRAGVGFYPGKERWVSLDDKQKLTKFLEKAKQKNKTLFIYDEVGKQVRWLQYTLEQMGIKDYYFMEKGAKAYYDKMATWRK